MSSAFVSKSRRVRFELVLRILDLNNVPLVSGSSFVKWHLPSSTAAEHRGRTGKAAIRDHRVHYNYDAKTTVRLTVGKEGNLLEEYPLDIEVLQEYASAGKGERIRLGQIRLNLAEYVDAAENLSPVSPGGGDGDEGITRRYLMQDSKINSTLKVGVLMRHLEGTREYTAPALRTAPVFGGIAGIISAAEQPSATFPHAAVDEDDENPSLAAEAPLPNFLTSNKEIGEMQDMYRRTLAAHWTAQPGELKADECVEDLFAGGDGWGKHGRPVSVGQLGHQRTGSGGSTTTAEHDEARPESKRGILGLQPRTDFVKYDRGGKSRSPRIGAGELSEMEVREDLIGWRISLASRI